MLSQKIEAIREARRLRGNPYAYIEELEEISHIHADRKRLEDPYAHIEKIEQDLPQSTRPIRKTVRSAQTVSVASVNRDYTNRQIEDAAIDLQRQLWRRGRRADGMSIDPVSILDVKDALNFIGFIYVEDDSLGFLDPPFNRIVVAGSIDSQSKEVRISSQLKQSTRNFTAAHELGHAILHGGMGLHRDRPIDNALASKDPIEYQADKFATYFLMPSKLVRRVFEEQFTSDSFVLTNLSALDVFGLQDQKELELGIPLRKLSLRLATTSSYRGVRFVPLAERFKVSPTAMAIRIEELGLVYMPEAE